MGSVPPPTSTPPRSRRWTCRRDAGDPRSQPTAGVRRACPLASNSAYVAQSQLSSMKALMTAILDLTPGTAPKRQVHRRSTAGLRKANQRSAQTATPRGAARDGPCVTRPRIPSRARMTGHAGSCGVISSTFYGGGGSLASPPCVPVVQGGETARPAWSVGYARARTKVIDGLRHGAG
jgi:hypothetical protein